MHELCSNDEIYKHTYLLFPAVTHLCGKLSTKPKPRPNNIHEYCDVLSSSQPSCSLKRKKEKEHTHTRTQHTLLKSSLVALISFQVLLSSWMQIQKNSSKARSWVKNMGWKSWQFSLAVDTKNTDS